MLGLKFTISHHCETVHAEKVTTCTRNIITPMKDLLLQRASQLPKRGQPKVI